MSPVALDELFEVSENNPVCVILGLESTYLHIIDIVVYLPGTLPAWEMNEKATWLKLQTRSEDISMRCFNFDHIFF